MKNILRIVVRFNDHLEAKNLIMNIFKKAFKLFFCTTLLCTTIAFAGNVKDKTVSHDTKSIEAITQQWASALSSNNPQEVANIYEPGAILYATFQNQLDTPDGIKGYFAKLMKHNDLAVKFTSKNIRMFGETALNSGLYTFSYMEKGKLIQIPARFTLVFTHSKEGWKIVEHHSSVLPE